MQTTTTEARPHDQIDQLWLVRSEELGYAEVLLKQWGVWVERVVPNVVDTMLPTGMTLERRVTLLESNRAEMLLGAGDALAAVSLTSTNIWVGVAGKDVQAAESLLGAIRDAFPDAEPQTDQPVVPLNVWTAGGPMGSMTSKRTMTAHRWEDIAANYAPDTRAALEGLATGFEPGASGKLLLLHGEPGTGKSTALASLAHAWSDWASVHLVIDPEVLLATPSYLLDVVAGRSAHDAPWRLVILEDSGELFAADARHVTGQSLSRLLNATDGMLAQGSKVLFAISTNEPLHSFHAAVARPGRCAASVEFQPLPATQAKEWLVERGAAEAAKALKGPATIAQLYAMASGTWEPQVERHAVGFYV
jgi:hypothetical protein